MENKINYFCKSCCKETIHSQEFIVYKNHYVVANLFCDVCKKQAIANGEKTMKGYRIVVLASDWFGRIINN